MDRPADLLLSVCFKRLRYSSNSCSCSMRTTHALHRCASQWMLMLLLL
jgi:hypothetical protein